MAVNPNSDEARILRKLIPLASFPNAAFAELCANIKLEHVQDAPLFKRGDTNTDLVYLLGGSVTLQSGDLIVETITSDSESAKFALAHQIPRKIDAVANGKALIVRLAADVVNNRPVEQVENHNYTITEATDEDSDDWMSVLLRSPVFELLPPANLQKILMTLKTRHYPPGEIIIPDGAEVEHFYVITKGQCLLSRRDSGEHQEVRLGSGESFGEEYLLTGLPAKETITALSEVSVVQLDKRHFLAEIKTPLLKFIGHEELPKALDSGAALMDVRPQQDYQAQHFYDSVNMPLLSLRAGIGGLSKDKEYILVCANGKASEAGAFLMTKNKFNAVVLEGGLGLEESVSPAENPDVVNDMESDFRAENARLVNCNRELEEKNLRLQAEKAELEQRCAVLSQQVATLKEFLRKFNGK